MADPLSRKHQLPKTIKKRTQVDRVCDHVLVTEIDNFKKAPSNTHVFFDAYTIIYGFSEACKMLERVRK